MRWYRSLLVEHSSAPSSPVRAAHLPSVKLKYPGYTADTIGRKRTLQLGSTIALVGCIIQTGAPNIAALIAGRLIAGIAIGVLTMIVPMYQVGLMPLAMS